MRFGASMELEMAVGIMMKYVSRSNTMLKTKRMARILLDLRTHHSRLLTGAAGSGFLQRVLFYQTTRKKVSAS